MKKHAKLISKILLFLLVLTTAAMFALPSFAAEGDGNLVVGLDNAALTTAIDTFWVLLAACLVFFMNLGFAAVEAGLARRKNTVNILSKNFIVFAVSSFGFLFLGWGLMFGGDNPIIGTSHLWILTGDNGFYADTLTSSVPFWGKFFFQLVFCGTAATIVSGAVAERIKYISFIIFSLVLTLIIYPVIGHWVWGGGWLARLGFADFAGDTVVHSLGGWAALIGAAILGPRIGKYDIIGKKKSGKSKFGKAHAIPGHSMALAVIGLFVLWLGWFGFNPGSTMSFQNPSDVMHILVTTNTGAIAAVVTSTITAWLYMGKPDLGMTINGALAGLVAVTGGCAYYSVLDSLIIGLLAGVLVVFLVGFFDKLHIDDPVGATSVHLGCGVFGTLCVALFANKEGTTTLAQGLKYNGLFHSGFATEGWQFLGVQTLGILVVGAFVVVTTGAVWFTLKKIPKIGMRVGRDEEIEGLDIGEHGNEAYAGFAIAPEELYEGGSPVALPITGNIPVSETIAVTDTSSPSARKKAKLTKVTIIANSTRLAILQSELDKIGITGMTVTNVLGYGMQKGHKEKYRGVEVETTLRPKIQVDIVITKVPVATVVETVKKALYTGNVGDGKIFIYDVENVVKVRTGEEGYDALQDD